MKKIKGSISILHFLFVFLPESLVSFLLSLILSLSLPPCLSSIPPSLFVSLSLFLNTSTKIPKEETN